MSAAILNKLQQQAGGLTIDDITFKGPPGANMKQVGAVMASALLPIFIQEGLALVVAPDDERDLAFATSIGMTAEQWLKMRNHWFGTGSK